MATWITRFDVTGSIGLRVAVKDLIDMTGVPTTAGSRAVAERAQPARADAACLAGLRAAEKGKVATAVGKANLHELALGVTGVNGWFGTPVNPLDPRRVPGGSSSGSAVAVASGEADVAIGSDTGGSVRIPAACCGVVGLKTTWGRVPLDGVWPLAPSLDTVGPLARDIGGVVAGMALLEPGFAPARSVPQTVGRLRVGASPAVEAAVDAALAAAGLDVVEIDVPGWRAAAHAAVTRLGAEAWRADGYLLAGGHLGADVARRLEGASWVTGAQLDAAGAVAAAWEVELGRLWRRVEVLALPTLTDIPPLLGDAEAMMTLRATLPVNLAGVPALSLPVPAQPLPASVQLVGPTGAEEVLVALGATIEAAVSK
ncbi:MAG TPA: amidase [Acidimicrobiales bacterium]|nr:amidase [Acidimicrobiales bacterium]